MYESVNQVWYGVHKDGVDPGQLPAHSALTSATVSVLGSPPDTKRIRELETGNRGIGKSDCVTGRITSTRPVHNHLLPTPRLTVSYLTIQYQTTFLWMGFCEI